MESTTQAVNCSSCTLDVKCLNRLVPGVKDFEKANKVMVTYLKGEILCKVAGFPSGVKTVLEGFVKVFVEGPGPMRKSAAWDSSACPEGWPTWPVFPRKAL